MSPSVSLSLPLSLWCVAVRSLEDNPAYDAGTGSVLNRDGKVEMDAMIMDGRTLKAGAVAAVGRIKNPVTLARAVMERTEHVLLVGEGASRFADEIGVERVDDRTLVTQEALEEFASFKQYHTAVDTLFNAADKRDDGLDSIASGHDTVGAVALDSEGNLACATSTGGITFKRVGRVGDSPLVGCGGYADSALGACSTTGHGESFIRLVAAYRAVLSLASSESPSQAAQRVLEEMWHRLRARGGIILIDAQGRVGHHGTTKRMAWASMEGSTGEELSPRVDYGVENSDAFQALQ